MDISLAYDVVNKNPCNALKLGKKSPVTLRSLENVCNAARRKMAALFTVTAVRTMDPTNNGRHICASAAHLMERSVWFQGGQRD
jgi:hypothetical protein